MLPKFTCVRDWKRYIEQQVAEMEKQHHLLGRRIIMVHGLLMEMPEEEQNFNYKRDDTSVGSDWSITGGFMPQPKPEPEESTHKRSADNKKDPPPTTSSSFQPAITPIKQESRSSSNCEECVKFPDETSTIGLHEPTPQSRSEKKSTGLDTRCVGSSNATAQFTQSKRGGVIALCEGAIYYSQGNCWHVWELSRNLREIQM
ncbi:unnamed protein product [Bursaphelenchus okinawaensis]|uniref:Uncharacterized protein n=1 Tax=Bursaphelenchus okinawaensis TaxID=465554 RepID=A0A811KBS9_9BILA|nr:unnamed protein product [Bursaphelenchus okinawaensis]CAG9101153.1 unnamed protein product [Bursaphelenchus okinawaensis]